MKLRSMTNHSVKGMAIPNTLQEKINRNKTPLGPGPMEPETTGTWLDHWDLDNFQCPLKRFQEVMSSHVMCRAFSPGSVNIPMTLMERRVE